MPFSFSLICLSLLEEFVMWSISASIPTAHLMGWMAFPIWKSWLLTTTNWMMMLCYLLCVFSTPSPSTRIASLTLKPYSISSNPPSSLCWPTSVSWETKPAQTSYPVQTKMKRTIADTGPRLWLIVNLLDDSTLFLPVTFCLGMICRLYVLHRLPRLKFLDSSPVKESERREAKQKGQYLKVVRPAEVRALWFFCCWFLFAKYQILIICSTKLTLLHRHRTDLSILHCRGISKQSQNMLVRYLSMHAQALPLYCIYFH